MGLFSFASPKNTDTIKLVKEIKPTWYIVNDGVMGGLSQGMYKTTPENTGVFQGNLSLENNGGFSWLKSRPTNWELEGYSGIKLRVKGDGRQYALTLKDGNRGRVLYFASFFDTKKEEWTDIELPFTGFKGYFYGQNVNPVTKMNLKLMSEIGIILLEKNPGEFEIEIDKIEVY